MTKAERSTIEPNADLMTMLQDDLETARGDPAQLERLYRRALAEGNDAAFKEALRHRLDAHPGDVLLEAWAHRLELPTAHAANVSGTPDRRWGVLIGASVLLGVLSAFMAQGKPPVPAPGDAAVLFWVGWGPLIALGLMAYLAWAERPAKRLGRYTVAAAAVVGTALYVGLTLGGHVGDTAELASLHLPFVAWAAVGGALCLGYPEPAKQGYAYLVKSVETLLTGGLFFGTGMVFVGLTYGIFQVLGIELPEEDLQIVAAWGGGAIPLLAMASVYDGAVSPLAQDWHAGLTRTLRILSHLMLPLALGVLLIYVLWFIPAYFQKPFEEREVLIVYNATIAAILVLLTVVVSGPADAEPTGRRSLFRYAVFTLAGLTFVLNGYALAAVVSRTLDAGLTPNRFAAMGWNITTLLIVSAVGVRLWRARHAPWMAVLRASIGQFVALAAVWALVLLLVLPCFT